MANGKWQMANGKFLRYEADQDFSICILQLNFFNEFATRIR